MRARSLVLSVLLLLPLGTAGAQSQPQPVVIKQVSDTDGTLTAVVTVVDAGGRPVAGLPREAFALRLDGAPVPVQEVRYGADPATPLAVVLALDVSGSMATADRLPRARAAATAFVDGLGANDLVAVLAFNQDVVFFTDFTADRAAVREVIGRLGATGNTALYTATVVAIAKAASAPLARTAVVLVTDGENYEPAARTTREAALAAAARGGVPVYSIGLGAEADRAYLDELAQVSRGQTRHAPTPADLERLQKEIGDALRGQYVLRGRPEPVRRAPSHTLRVEVRADAVTGADEVTFPGTGLATLPDPTPQPTPSPVATPTVSATTAAPAAVPAPREEGRGRAGVVALALAALVVAGAGGAGGWTLLRRRRAAAAGDRPLNAPSAPPAPVPSPPKAAAVVAPLAVLRVCRGPLAGMEVPMRGEPVTIGTAATCAVVLPADGDGVERLHARVWHRDGRYMLHRLARTGVVSMDGRPIQWVVLESGDEFDVGPHRFAFRLHGN
jgi:VWFA-related protein